MSYQPIFRGAQPNDNTGDNLREGARKINANFTEIYAALGTGSTITYNMNSFVLNDVSNVTVPMPLHEQVLSWDNNTSTWIAVDKLSGNVVGHMIPTSNNTYDLGDPTHEFRDIFLSGNAVFSPDSQRLFSDNGVLSVQYDYQTSNATLLDTDDSTASSATSQDIYFSNTSVMDSVTVGGTTIYLFPGIDLSSSAPYALLQNINLELTLSNSSFSNTYTNYDETTYGTAIGTHADSFYFSGPTSVTVKNGQLAPANTAQSPLQIEQDLLDADTAQLVIKRISSDGIGEVIVSNRTQTITNKTIPAANNSILMSIGDLFDVTNSGANTASDGDVLFYRASANSWIPAAPGTHPISGAIVNGHLLPTANAAYDLGSPTSQFKDLYMTGNSIHLGSTTISSVGGKINFSGASLEITDHVIPNQNEAYDLGSATNKFRDLYLSSSSINLGAASLSVGPEGLGFREKAPVVLFKEGVVINPNLNSVYTWALNGNTQPQLFGIDGLDSFGGHDFWPGRAIVDNHIEFIPSNIITAELTLLAETGEILHKFDLLQEGAGDWIDDPANGFINVDTQNKGFIIDNFGKLWIKYPTNQVGFETLMQGVVIATFSIIDIRDATPVKPVKPVDNPAGISASNVPANSSATGTKGDIVVGANYVYICKDTDSWVRVAIDTGW